MSIKAMYMVRVGGGMDGSSPTGFASQCKACNKCVKVCTQHIDIPAKLKEASKTLESPGMKAMFIVAKPIMKAYMGRERRKNLQKARS